MHRHATSAILVTAVAGLGIATGNAGGATGVSRLPQLVGA
jgi:hypothetical protein